MWLNCLAVCSIKLYTPDRSSPCFRCSVLVHKSPGKRLAARATSNEKAIQLSGLYDITISAGVFPARAKWLLVHGGFSLFDFSFLKEDEELKRNNHSFLLNIYRYNVYRVLVTCHSKQQTDSGFPFHTGVGSSFRWSESRSYWSIFHGLIHHFTFSRLFLNPCLRCLFRQ